jgi:2-oxoglutarate ferredoxin oxidoreductase subunit alpha
MDDAQIGLIAYGSTDPAVQEARVRLIEGDIPTDYLRITALPFTEEVEAFVRSHETVYVIEMNHTGQMRQLLQLDFPDQAVKLQSIRKDNGLPLSAKWITEALLEAEGM